MAKKKTSSKAVPKKPKAAAGGAKTAKKAVKKASAPRKPAARSGASAAPKAKRRTATSASTAKTKRVAVKAKTTSNRKPTSKAAAAGGKPAPVKTNLTARELNEFRQMLMDKRQQLMGDVGTLQSEAMRGSRQDSSGDLSSMPVHMADLGTDNYELEFTLGLLEGGREMLNEIDEALERVRNGTYGMCAATGKPIGKQRLRAKPWAKYCYEYTLAMERGTAPRT